MPPAIDDVSFPLFGKGATARIDDRLPLRLLALCGCTLHSGWQGTDLSAPTWRIYCNLDEGAEAHLGRQRLPFAARQLYVIPAWLPWTAACCGRVRHLNAMLDLPSLPRERVRSACRSIVCVAGPEDPLTTSWLHLAADLAATATAGPALQARGLELTWAVLARYLHHLGPAAEALLPTTRDRALEHLCAWIDTHLGEPLPRARLAHEAGCSEAALARRFASSLGTSPATWIRQRRVARTSDLLRSTDLSLEEIAQRCGFADRSRLTRVFTELVGCPPARWRRNG